MKKLILFLLFCFLMSQRCFASEPIDELFPEADIYQAKDKLSDNAMDIVDMFDMKSGQGISKAFEKLWTQLLQTITNSLDTLYKPIILIFAIITFCSVIEPLFSGPTKSFPLLLFGCVEILNFALSDSKALFNDGIAALRNLYDFSTVLLPCLAGTSVMAGASISAGVKYTAAALFMNLLLNFSNTFLIPLISVYLIFVVGNTVFEQKLLSVLASFIRWGCKMLLTAATIAFTAYLNVAGLISSTGDIFAERITKTALSSALPVVGSILSDAASSLVAGAAIVRNSIGIFGLLSVAAILLFPFINLGVRYLLFIAVSRLADLFPNHRFSSLLNGIAGAYGMLLGVIGSGMIMIFLTLISFMQIVGG